ncbi:MAG: response regulator, partial [Planctomycetia bacterium]
MPAANLIIAHPNQLIRLGLTSVFRYVKKIVRVFGEAATGEELTRVVRNHAPDLVLMNNRLPDADSFDVMRKLFAIRPAINIVLV